MHREEEEEREEREEAQGESLEILLLLLPFSTPSNKPPTRRRLEPVDRRLDHGLGGCWLRDQAHLSHFSPPCMTLFMTIMELGVWTVHEQRRGGGRGRLSRQRKGCLADHHRFQDALMSACEASSRHEKQRNRYWYTLPWPPMPYGLKQKRVTSKPLKDIRMALSRDGLCQRQ